MHCATAHQKKKKFNGYSNGVGTHRNAGTSFTVHSRKPEIAALSKKERRRLRSLSILATPKNTGSYWFEVFKSKFLMLQKMPDRGQSTPQRNGGWKKFEQWIRFHKPPFEATRIMATNFRYEQRSIRANAG